MKIKHTALLQMNVQLLYKRKRIQNKLSWNNLFIDQTYLLDAILLQQDVRNEWLIGLNNIERSF